MRKLTYAGLVLVFLCSATPAFAQSVSISFAPDNMLPGLPPSMSIEVTDWSSNAPEFALWVEREGQSGFFAMTGDRRASPVARHFPQAVITTGERSVRIDADVTEDLRNIPWFVDPRLSEPGVYVLRLVAAGDLSAVYGRSDVKLEDVSSIVVSSPTVFTVLAPKGDDLAVWTKMQALPPGDRWDATNWFGSGRDIAEFVWSEHEQSGYAPYVAGFHSAQPSTLLKALELFPNSSLEDWHRYLLAVSLRHQMSEANAQKDYEKVDRLANEAKTQLGKVVHKAGANRAAKKKAAEELEGVARLWKSYRPRSDS